MGAIGHKVTISCSMPMAPSARHREKGQETLPSGGPKDGTGASKTRALPQTGGVSELRSLDSRLFLW